MPSRISTFDLKSALVLPILICKGAVDWRQSQFCNILLLGTPKIPN